MSTPKDKGLKVHWLGGKLCCKGFHPVRVPTPISHSFTISSLMVSREQNPNPRALKALEHGFTDTPSGVVTH